MVVQATVIHKIDDILLADAPGIHTRQISKYEYT